jgi:hypothetical protein
MTKGEPELQKRFRELIQDASRFAEAGETKSALTLLRSAQQIAADLTSTIIRARALNEIGYIGFQIGLLKEAESAFQQVLDYPQGDVADDILISVRLGLGLLYHANKRFGEGAVQLSAASDLAAKLGAENLREIAFRKLGECYLTQVAPYRVSRDSRSY